MRSEFKISVVIPTFNRAALLQRAIDSVLAQSYPVAEVIVIDDGSTDGTRQLVTSIPQHRIQYTYQDNQGVSCARNTGIKQATGNWIALLDSDDEWLPNKLETQIRALRDNPHYGFCHTNELWVRNGKRVNPMIKHEKNGGYIFEKCLPLCVISPSSVLIEKSVFEETGLFDESLPACEDYDLWLRYCATKPVLYVDEPLLVKYGGHEDQLSRKYLGMDRFRLQALVKLITTSELATNQVNAIKTTFLNKYKILYSGAQKHQNTEIINVCEKLFHEMHVELSQIESAG